MHACKSILHFCKFSDQAPVRPAGQRAVPAARRQSKYSTPGPASPLSCGAVSRISIPSASSRLLICTAPVSARCRLPQNPPLPGQISHSKHPPGTPGGHDPGHSLPGADRPCQTVPASHPRRLPRPDAPVYLISPVQVQGNSRCSPGSRLPAGRGSPGHPPRSG